MASLQKRLIYSSVLIPICLIAIFSGSDLLFFLVVEAFSLLGLNEFLILAEKKNLPINRFLGLFWGALLPVSVYFSYEAVVLVMACLCLFIYNFNRKVEDNPLISTSVTIFGLIYVTWFFAHLLKVRHLDFGSWWIFYSILIVKGGDAGAYFVGKKFGKMKLIAHVSPNKSVEGAIGNLITCVVLSLISKIYLTEIPFVHLFFLGLILGVVSQLGDLAESLIKRDVGVKDSGNIPGLGGILDVLDSLLLSIPIVYYYIVGFITRV